MRWALRKPGQKISRKQKREHGRIETLCATYRPGRSPLRQREGGTPIIFLKARLNAASDS